MVGIGKDAQEMDNRACEHVVLVEFEPQVSLDLVCPASSSPQA